MRIAFLGQGPFANPIKQKLKRVSSLVPVNQAEVVVVASWGKILTKHEIEDPKYGTLNIHPSLLPKYRGATPIQWAIIKGDHQTGVTIIKMDEKMDHGPILAQQKVAIAKEETNDSLTRKLSELGVQMIVKLLTQYIDGKIKPVGQDHSKATFIYRFKKDDGLLDMDDQAELNERKVRALWPWPGAWIELDGKKLFIHRSHIENANFIPDIVQLEGRKKMSFHAFKLGWRKTLPFK